MSCGLNRAGLYGSSKSKTGWKHSKVTFETELNDEALGALRSYLAKRNEQLDMRLSEQLEKLYAATVPAAVREYLGEKNGTPVQRSAARPRRAAPAAGHAEGNQPAE